MTDIERRFRHTTSITEAQKETISYFEDEFVSMAEKIDGLNDGREKSLCLTKLQEAKFWCIEAIAKEIYL